MLIYITLLLLYIITYNKCTQTKVDPYHTSIYNITSLQFLFYKSCLIINYRVI